MHRETACARLLVVIACLMALIITCLSPPSSQASDLGLVEADCRCCHGASLADRHHLLVPESGLECLDCHALTFNNTTFQYDVAVLRDCLQCHTGSLADRHHLLAQPGGYECLDCHALVFNPESFQYDTVFNFFCEATTPPPPTPVATVTGTVSDQNGGGLAWATVTTEDGSSTALTSETGDYQLTDIPAGVQTLVANLDGYDSEQLSISVSAPLTSSVNFTLTRQPAEICGDGLDNDDDGLVDCSDPDCGTSSACLPVPAESCNDGVDNNGNGLADCDDPDCSTTSACLPPPVEICGDGFDNDGNGLTDCDDDKCASHSACLGVAETERCGNGIDDDNDDKIDCADDECLDDPACSVAAPIEFCENIFDDDNDGLADCQDPDCRNDSVCLKAEIVEICDNGIDDDGDGRVDCRDRDCKKDRNVCKRKFAFGKRQRQEKWDELRFKSKGKKWLDRSARR